jgi:hypothetical protein
MWDDIYQALETHDSAVLTAFDASGFPFSIRCKPVVDRANKRLLVELPNPTEIQPGKAGLLMHSHNDELWDLVQFLLRGTLVRGGDGWYFVPASAHGTPRVPGALDTMRQLRAMRGTADRYLKHRGLPRPEVPWDDIQRLHEEAADLRRQQT